MQAILHDPTDTTRVSLVFGNVTEEDILLRTELEDMAKKHPDRIKLHFLLDKPDPVRARLPSSRHPRPVPSPPLLARPSPPLPSSPPPRPSLPPSRRSPPAPPQSFFSPRRSGRVVKAS